MPRWMPPNGQPGSVPVAPPPTQLPPAAPSFRRSGLGLLLELGAGSVVAVPSGLLFDHWPRSLQAPGLGGALIAFGAITVVGMGTVAAVGAAAYATDGSSGSLAHDVVGLGLGSILGFGFGAGALDSAAGPMAPTPSTALLFLGMPLGAVVGYNLIADDDAQLPDASTRVSRKLSLCLVLGGNTLGGTGLDLGFQLADRFGIALQGIDSELGGGEASARLRGYFLAAHRSGMYLSAGLHMTTGVSRATELNFRTVTAVAAGAMGAIGGEFRGESGVTVAAELSTVYESGAPGVANTGHGPFYSGGALLIGYAR